MMDTELLRLVTAGSVDDGKSTLIGRLLFDTKQILADQLEHIEDASRRRGHDYVDLALLTDGLRAEREQGITIDVAYRSFVTPRRRFQLADAPGHVQYTRNMVTGASTADLGVILVDARRGVVEQTRRHSYIVSMLELPHVVYVVNKMDLVRELDELSRLLGLHDVSVIPVSALKGDNVVDRTDAMPWYAGITLLEHLEAIELAEDRNYDLRRFPVQWVIRPMADEHHDYRGYAGQVASGVWRAGDEVLVQPSGLRSRVASVEMSEGPLDEAIPGQSVTIRLTDDVDVARGDLLTDPERPATVARELLARLCWMSERPLEPRARLVVKQTTRTARAIVDELVSVVDIETLADVMSPERMQLNDLGLVRLRLSEPLAVDAYAESRATGAFILIDEGTNETVGAGMVVEAS
jgi:sulfate adenylyltransferase large subunit